MCPRTAPYTCLAVVLLLAVPGPVSAQPKPVSDPAAFDFWLGTWDIVFESSNGPGKGITTVSKILGGRALHEAFLHTEGPSTGFEAVSISTVDAAAGVWKRTWMDNFGGVQSFEAFSDGDRVFFERHYSNNAGQPMVARMIYYDIEADRFSWIWEVSSDSGSTWQTVITTEYTRKKG